MNKLVLLYIYNIPYTPVYETYFFLQFSSQSRGASYRQKEQFGTQSSVFHHNPTISLLCLFCFLLLDSYIMLEASLVYVVFDC